MLVYNEYTGFIRTPARTSYDILCIGDVTLYNVKVYPPCTEA